MMSWAKSKTPSQKNNQRKKITGVNQMLECLLCKHNNHVKTPVLPRKPPKNHKYPTN
jgi:hypothetical protein